MKVLNLNKKKWRQHRDEIENWILLAKLMETHRTTIDERFSTNFNQHMNKKKKKLKHRTAESKMRWNKYKSSNIHFTIWIVWSEKKENNNYTEGRGDENHFAFPYRNWCFSGCLNSFHANTELQLCFHIRVVIQFVFTCFCVLFALCIRP